MAEGRMTAEQLAEFIKKTVAPLIKDTAGPQVAELVKEAIEKQAKPQWGAAELVAAMRNEAGQHSDDGAKGVKGAGFSRYVRAMAAAKGDKEKAARIAATWGYKDVADQITKSVEKAMAAGDPTAGGFLVPEQFSNEVIELLRPSGTVRSLGPEEVPMPTGIVRIPKITSGSTASYVGENTNATKSQVGTGQITMQAKKLISLVPVSNDLLRFSSPSADTIVRNDMIRAMVAREDKAFIRDDGTAATPKGVKNWMASANKFAANSTVNLDNVTNDLGKAIQNLMDNNVNLIMQQGATPQIDVRPGWLMSPRTWRYLTTVRLTNGPYAFRDEMMRGTLWGYPYRVTSQVLQTYTANQAAETGGDRTEVYFGAFAYCVIGQALSLIVDASQEAAYHDGSNVIAAFSQDQTVVRVLAEHDFALRQDVAFSLINEVRWGA